MTTTQVFDVEALEQQEFSINSADFANWAIERVKEERARRDLFLEAAQGQIERLQQQIKNASDKCNARTGFLLIKLDEYLESVPAKETKTQKSLELPAGKLVRKLPSIEFVRDNEKLIEALKGTDFVEMKANLKWAEFKKNLTVVDGLVVHNSTGEAVEGLSVEEKPATFDVK